MKVLMLSLLILFAGMAAKAQSGTAFLSITLSDVQSVKINSATASNIQATQGSNQTGDLQVLREWASQVKTIQPNSSEYERLYKEIYSGAANDPSSASGRSAGSVALNRDPKAAKSQNNGGLVIYQIDPR